MSRYLHAQRHRALGLVFVAGVVAFVVFCVGQYNGVFTPTADVTLRLESAGLQLLTGSDVKVRGIVVGTVRGITSDGRAAELDLALDPDKLHNLPADVTARLVPKTLFGEKYVDLLIPADPAGARLASGAQIAEDTSQATIEINRVLDNLLPLLRSVRPEDLNATLGALATALDGRGEQLGQTLVQADDYLRGLNPQLPQLRRDLTLLADVAQVYDQAAPDLLATLRNLITPAETVVAHEATLASFLQEVTGAADVTRDLLAANEDNLVRVNAVNRDLVGVLAEYSPVFSCFFRGFALLKPRIDNAVGDTPETKGFAHVVVEFGQPAPEYRFPENLPEYNDTSPPDCYGLPNPTTPQPKLLFKDGTEDDPRFATGPGVDAPARTSSPSAMRGGLPSSDGAMGALLAPTMGVPAEQVPDIGGLLWMPLMAGGTVSLL